jgi:outer membrane protein OmpA-like peptidoglycan-associated protein
MNKLYFAALSIVLILSGCGVKKTTKNQASSNKGAVASVSKSPIKSKYDEKVGAFVLEDDADYDLFDESAESVVQQVRGSSKTEEQFAWQELEEENQEELQTVYFDYDNDAVRSSEQGKIQENVKQALTAVKSGAEVLIDGHACLYSPVGGEVYNTALSQRRAMRVAKEYKKLGVPENKMKVVGRGSSQAICFDESKEAQAVNRRATTSLIYPKSSKAVSKKK